MSTITRSFASPTSLIEASNHALNASYYALKFKPLSEDLSLDDCLAALPIVRNSDLAADPGAFNPDRLETKNLISYSSSGYSKYSKTISLTPLDLELHSNHLSMFLKDGGVWDPSCRAIVVAPLNTNKVASFFAHHMAYKICAEVRLVDMFNFEELLSLLNTRSYPQIFIPVPVLVLLLEHCRTGGVDASNWLLKHVLTGGVVLPDSVRKSARIALGATVRNLYGMSETGSIIACDGFCGMGLHFMPDSYIGWELLSIENTSYGEFVVTCLRREGTQILRYATGDIMEDVSHLCSCPSPKKMLRWIGRMDDMYPAGQMNVWWNGIMERRMFKLNGLIDYRIILNRNSAGLDHLNFKIISTHPISRDELLNEVIKMDEELYLQVKNGFILLTVESMAQEDFTKNLFKPKRIIDMRV
jgi:phenylacetate-CoA ligase